MEESGKNKTGLDVYRFWSVEQICRARCVTSGLIPLWNCTSEGEIVLGFVGTERDFSEEQLLQAYGINYKDGINSCELVLTAWAFVND